MSKKEFEKLLYRYLAGQCTVEEEKWLDKYYVLLDKEPSEKLNEEDLVYLESELWHSIEARTVHIIQDSGQEAATFRIWPYLGRIAASIVLVLGCFGLIKWQLNKPEISPFTAKASAEIEIINTSGKTMHHDFRDGSIVWLEPGASIKYSRYFSSDKRDVYLNGDAFFDVTHDLNRPFRVFGKKVVVKVLGTSFRVNIIPDQPNTEVSVRTGKVAVYPLPGKSLIAPISDISVQESKFKGIMLAANQKVIINADANKVEREELAFGHWENKEKETSMIFNNTPLKEVIQQIEDAYKVSIQVDDSIIKTCSFTATLTDLPLDIKLEIICKSIGAKYKAKNGKYAIIGEGCQNVK